MKVFKRSLAMILLVLVTVMFMPAMAAADTPEMPVHKAGQNDGLTWTVKDGVLRISGNDAMTEFYLNCDENLSGYMEQTSAPWTSERENIKTVVIDNGVTSIGWYAFYHFTNLETVYIGKGITDIQTGAFGACPNLKKVYFALDKVNDYVLFTLSNEENAAFNNAEWVWNTAYKSEGQYTITYVLNKGKNNSENPLSYTAKDDTITLKKATRKGYTFQGWYKKSDFSGDKVTKIDPKSKKNVKLYAKWKANKYTIKYSANGGTGSMKSKACTYGKTYTLAANTFKKSGYKFAGWNTKKDGSGKTYKNKASVKNLSSKSGGSVTLYAIWSDGKEESKDTKLDKVLLVLTKTCEPAYRWHNNDKVSSQVTDKGYKKWSCRTSANGSLANINAYNSKGSFIGSTACRWNEPILTSTEEINCNDAYDYLKSLREGTYDFTGDPAKLTVGWAMFKDSTTKTELEGMMNHTVSQKVYEDVIAKYNYSATMTAGGSCIIVYRKDKNGKLIGAYAGSLYYNQSSSSASYYLIGTDPLDSDHYGKLTKGTLKY